MSSHLVDPNRRGLLKSMTGIALIAVLSPLPKLHSTQFNSTAIVSTNRSGLSTCSVNCVSGCPLQPAEKLKNRS